MSYAMSHSMPLVRTSSQKSEEFCPSSPVLSEARWENCGTSAASRKSTDALPSSCRKTLASIAIMSPSCVAVSLPWEGRCLRCKALARLGLSNDAEAK